MPEHQAIAFKLADMATEIEAARAYDAEVLRCRGADAPTPSAEILRSALQTGSPDLLKVLLEHAPSSFHSGFNDDPDMDAMISSSGMIERPWSSVVMSLRFIIARHFTEFGWFASTVRARKKSS